MLSIRRFALLRALSCRTSGNEGAVAPRRALWFDDASFMVSRMIRGGSSGGMVAADGAESADDD
jgi:hypothetical protein